MKKFLHVLTKENDALASEVLSQQQSPEWKLEIVDLTQGQPDYANLVEKIFEADSVAVW